MFFSNINLILRWIYPLLPFWNTFLKTVKLMKNKKWTIFSKLSSCYLGSLLECIWTPQLKFCYQIKHRSFGKNFSFFKIFGVKSQFLIKDEQKENKCASVVYMRGLNDFRVIWPNPRIATLQLFIILAIRCVNKCTFTYCGLGGRITLVC